LGLVLRVAELALRRRAASGPIDDNGVMQPDPFDVSLFATTNNRGRFTPFGIRQADRFFHMYAIGQTGVGKSSLIEVLTRQDLAAGRGFALIDPHGDLVERIYASIPENQRERVTYLNAPDREQPFGYNPLRRVRDERIPLAASGMLETLRKLWPDAWGVRMEHVLRNSLYALLERDGSTLPDILELYANDKFRKQVVAGIRNDVVKAFWLNEFENYPARLRADAVMPVQNKLGALLSDPLLYRILVTPQVDLRFRTLMDDGRLLLVNLSKGHIGEDASHLLGGLIASTLGLAAFTRADQPLAQRRPFFVYLDEFQTFTTLAFVNMLSELRKFGVGLVLAHQFLSQLEPQILHAVLGNVGTVVAFRLGPEDARVLAGEFSPAFGAEDLANLPNRSCYLRLMIDGTPSPPFSARTLGTSVASGDD
jgi:hypothetical protein